MRHHCSTCARQLLYARVDPLLVFRIDDSRGGSSGTFRCWRGAEESSTHHEGRTYREVVWFDRLS